MWSSCRHVRQVRRRECQLDISRTDGVYSMPRQVARTRDSDKRHLLGEHQYECLEQQRKAAELTDPSRFDQPHGAIGQAHTRHPHFQDAFVLKEIQVTQTVDLRVVYRMLTGNSSIGKPAARDEVHGDGQLMLSGIKVNAMNVLGRGYSKSGFEQLIRHGSFVSHGWLPHSAATSHGSAYQFWAPQGFASPGLRPSLTRQTTH